MKPKFLKVLEQCIETGIELGWNRAHKHTDTPTKEQIKTAMGNAITDELYEWFDFEELDNE